jgi:hypothetical protein
MITHPFHPMRGQQFVLTAHRINWGEDRVMYFNKEAKLRSIPASWTSVANTDIFQRAAAGQSWFRLDDLLDLSAMLHTLKQAQRRCVK